MKSFHSRTVLVTGASSGIGEAMARQLARDSAHLLLTARSEDKLHELAAEFRSLGAQVDVFVHDLGEPGAAHTLWERITEAGHSPDVLINNAGFGRLCKFVECDVAMYEEMITLNVMNLVALTRLALPDMISRGTGGVLNLASTAAFQPVPYFAVYSATKAFIRSFSEALSSEVKGTGVHVTCLCPGPTMTGFGERAGIGNMGGGHLVDTPETVADVGLEALLDNERTQIVGAVNTAAAFATRFAPRTLVLEAAKRAMELQRS